ncbi:MAG: FtsX-like permease family protein [Acidimicrobiales bacterium]
MTSGATATTGFVWRAHRRGKVRTLLGAALVIGLLGGVALASLAGARRTASTFAAYERQNRLSHLAVNTFVPDLDRVNAIAELPGVDTSATWLGLDAYPVLDGEVIRDFRYTGVFGSYDGRFLTQDIATVVSGRLPRLDAVDEVVFTPGHAEFFGVGVGDEITYHYEGRPDDPREPSTDLGESTYRIVGIVELPPVLVDEYDIFEGAVLPPAATAERIDSFYYAWQGLRLEDGIDGIDPFIEQVVNDPRVNHLPPVLQRNDLIRAQVQRAVRPQAIALGLFGAAALVATLALGGQGVGRLVSRWRAPIAPLRAVGMARRQRILLASLDALVAVGVGAVLAAAVAVGLSPLAPVGAVRRLDPDGGFVVDATVTLGGAALLAVLLSMGAVAVAGRLTRPVGRAPVRRPAWLAQRAAAAGAPVPVVVGARFALYPGPDERSTTVGGALAGGAIALGAIVAATVFGASLVSVISQPARFGWGWDHMLIAEGGYGALDPDLVDAALADEPDVTASTLVAFSDLQLGELTVPGMGVESVVPGIRFTINDGRAPEGPDEVALGSVTMGELGVRVGDQVPASTPEGTTMLEVVGSMTFPSIGIGGADHPSLGRGALLSDDGLRALVSPGQACYETEGALCSQAILLDVADGADADAVIQRIIARNPDNTPGGTYEQGVTRAADIRNYDQMRQGPLALAAVLAVAAIAGLVLTLVSSVKSRRRELALLKALGLARAELRATIRAQALVTALVAVVAGLPLGVVAGRLAWTRFAEGVGVPPSPVQPPVALALIVLVALAAGAIGSALPAALAARTPVNEALRAE